MTDHVVISEVDVLTSIYVVLNEAEKHVPYGELVGSTKCRSGPGSSVCIATGYGLDNPRIESRWGANFPHLSRPDLGPT
jgi:hypothetical protein